MSACALVIDTSYLWDFFGVPARPELGETDAERLARKSRMRAVFAEAFQDAAHLYVPYAVIFEIANAVAHIKDDGLRKELTGALVQSVERSLESMDGPWIITPWKGTYLLKDDLLTLCQKFRHASVNCMGLTDVAILHEAERVKSKHSAEGRHVHIWTLDRALKRSQPDHERPTCPGARAAARAGA